MLEYLRNISIRLRQVACPSLTTFPIALLCHHRASSGALISPCRGQNTHSLVISAEAVNPGLDENESELAVLVLAVALEVLTHSDGFLDQHVEIFWDFGCETYVTLSVYIHEGDQFRGCVEL